MKKLSVLPLMLIIIIFINSCASSPNITVPPNGRIIDKDFTGIVHAGENSEDFPILNEIGASWVMHTFYWGRIEWARGNWTFETYDKRVEMANEAGLKVLGVLAYTVPWVEDPSKRKNRYIDKERLPHYLEYVRTLAERYRGKVDAWCVWNEPNVGRFWHGTDEDYVEMVKQSIRVIKEVDSEVKIVSGAFTRGILTYLPKKMMSALFESGAMEYADGVAFHPYELTVNRSVRLLNDFIKFTESYGFSGKIWITEIGYPTGGWYPTKVSPEKLPETVIKVYAQFAAMGVINVFWYEMYDSPELYNSSPESRFGLAISAGNPESKALHAFRLCAQNFSDSTCYAQIPDKDNSTYNIPKNVKAFWFKRENTSALVLWKEGNGSFQLPLNLPGSGHLRHNIFSGSTENISQDAVLKIKNEPVFITWHNN